MPPPNVYLSDADPTSTSLSSPRRLRSPPPPYKGPYLHPSSLLFPRHLSNADADDDDDEGSISDYPPSSRSASPSSSSVYSSYSSVPLLSSPERGERENGSRLSKKRNGYSHLGNGDVDGGGEKDPFRDPEDVKMRMNSFSGTHGKPALKRSPSSIQKTINAAKDYVKAKNPLLSSSSSSPKPTSGPPGGAYDAEGRWVGLARYLTNDQRANPEIRVVPSSPSKRR